MAVTNPMELPALPLKLIIQHVLSCTQAGKAARLVCKAWKCAFAPVAFSLANRHDFQYHKLECLQSFSSTLQRLTVTNAWVMLEPWALAVPLRQLRNLEALTLGPFIEDHLELYGPELSIDELGVGWAQVMDVVLTLPSLRRFKMECPLLWLPQHSPSLLDDLRARFAKVPLSSSPYFAESEMDAAKYRGLESIELRLVWTMHPTLGVECTLDFHLNSLCSSSFTTTSTGSGAKAPAAVSLPFPAWEVSVNMPDTHAEALCELPDALAKALGALLPNQNAPASALLAAAGLTAYMAMSPAKAQPARSDGMSACESEDASTERTTHTVASPPPPHAMRLVGLATALSAGPGAEALLGDTLRPAKPVHALAQAVHSGGLPTANHGSLRALTLHVIYNAPSAPAELLALHRLPLGLTALTHLSIRLLLGDTNGLFANGNPHPHMSPLLCGISSLPALTSISLQCVSPKLFVPLLSPMSGLRTLELAGRKQQSDVLPLALLPQHITALTLSRYHLQGTAQLTGLKSLRVFACTSQLALPGTEWASVLGEMPLLKRLTMHEIACPWPSRYGLRPGTQPTWMRWAALKKLADMPAWAEGLASLDWDVDGHTAVRMDDKDQEGIVALRRMRGLKVLVLRNIQPDAMQHVLRALQAEPEQAVTVLQEEPDKKSVLHEHAPAAKQAMQLGSSRWCWGSRRAAPDMQDVCIAADGSGDGRVICSSLWCDPLPLHSMAQHDTPSRRSQQPPLVDTPAGQQQATRQAYMHASMLLPPPPLLCEVEVHIASTPRGYAAAHVVRKPAPPPVPGSATTTGTGNNTSNVTTSMSSSSASLMASKGMGTGSGGGRGAGAVDLRWICGSCGSGSKAGDDARSTLHEAYVQVPHAPYVRAWGDEARIPSNMHADAGSSNAIKPTSMDNRGDPDQSLQLVAQAGPSTAFTAPAAAGGSQQARRALLDSGRWSLPRHALQCSMDALQDVQCMQDVMHACMPLPRLPWQAAAMQEVTIGAVEHLRAAASSSNVVVDAAAATGSSMMAAGSSGMATGDAVQGVAGNSELLVMQAAPFWQPTKGIASDSTTSAVSGSDAASMRDGSLGGSSSRGSTGSSTASGSTLGGPRQAAAGSSSSSVSFSCGGNNNMNCLVPGVNGSSSSQDWARYVPSYHARSSQGANSITADAAGPTAVVSGQGQGSSQLTSVPPKFHEQQQEVAPSTRAQLWHKGPAWGGMGRSIDRPGAWLLPVVDVVAAAAGAAAVDDFNYDKQYTMYRARLLVAGAAPAPATTAPPPTLTASTSAMQLTTAALHHANGTGGLPTDAAGADTVTASAGVDAVAPSAACTYAAAQEAMWAMLDGLPPPSPYDLPDARARIATAELAMRADYLNAAWAMPLEVLGLAGTAAAAAARGAGGHSRSDDGGGPGSGGAGGTNVPLSQQVDESLAVNLGANWYSAGPGDAESATCSTDGRSGSSSLRGSMPSLLEEGEPGAMHGLGTPPALQSETESNADSDTDADSNAHVDSGMGVVDGMPGLVNDDEEYNGRAAPAVAAAGGAQMLAALLAVGGAGADAGGGVHAGGGMQPWHLDDDAFGPMPGLMPMMDFNLNMMWGHNLNINQHGHNQQQQGQQQQGWLHAPGAVAAAAAAAADMAWDDEDFDMPALLDEVEDGQAADLGGMFASVWPPTASPFEDHSQYGPQPSGRDERACVRDMQALLCAWAPPPTMHCVRLYMSPLQDAGACSAWHGATPRKHGLPLACVVRDAAHARNVGNIAPPPLSGPVHEA